MKRERTRITGFTLLEILAVLAIIAIVLSITVPTFGPMIRTLKLKTAAQNLANTLEAARQYAVTNSQECYIAFMVSGDMSHKSYRIFDANWSPVDKWEFLPKGLTIDKDSTLFKVAGGPRSIPFPEEGPGSEMARYLYFEGNGKINKLCTIVILEAQSNMYSSVRFSDFLSKVRVLGIEKKAGD